MEGGREGRGKISEKINIGTLKLASFRDFSLILPPSLPPSETYGPTTVYIEEHADEYPGIEGQALDSQLQVRPSLPHSLPPSLPSSV